MATPLSTEEGRGLVTSVTAVGCVALYSAGPITVQYLERGVTTRVHVYWVPLCLEK